MRQWVACHHTTLGTTTNMLQTSALDTHTEQALLQNINSILKEEARTSVFVAHRLRTIYDSDKIIVLNDGCVAESGTHNDLINMGGVYSALWHGELPRTRRSEESNGSHSSRGFT